MKKGRICSQNISDGKLICEFSWPKISHIMYKIVQERQRNGGFQSQWLAHVQDSLNQSGLGNIFGDEAITTSHSFIKATVKRRLTDIGYQDWHSTVMDSSHCYNYRIFKKELNLDTYLVNLDAKNRTCLSRFRCGNHSLPIVTGRYTRVEHSERKCPLCKSGDIGDEFHYIFHCSAFDHDRSILLANNVRSRPSTVTMVPCEVGTL